MANRTQEKDSNRVIVAPIHHTIDDIKDSISLQMSGSTKYVPVWVGRPGIAKSSIMKQIAEELDMNLYYVSGSKPLEFWTGLPITNVLSLDKIQNKEDTYVYWSQPEPIHISNEMAKKKPTIIFLDDLHIMEGQCQKVLFELILERSLHGHDLSKNIAMVGAMNHSAEAGNDGFYSAIVNRLQWIHVKMDFNFWYENVGVGLNKYIGSFLRANGEYREEEESTESPFATYRSWTELANMITARMNRKGKNESTDIYRLARGFCSNSAALALKNHIDIYSKCDLKATLKSKTLHNVSVDTSIDQIMLSYIVREIENDDDKNYLFEYLVDKATSQKYSSLLLAVSFELKNYIDHLQKKTNMKRYNLRERIEMGKKAKNANTDETFTTKKKEETPEERSLKCLINLEDSIMKNSDMMKYLKNMARVS